METENTPKENVNKNSSERMDAVDTARGIAILLVVFGHALAGNGGRIHHYIYAFHMPLFFIISGFVLKWEKMSLKEARYWLQKKIHGYVVPYFLLMLIAGELSLENIKNYIFVTRNLASKYPLLAKWYLPCFFVSICMTQIACQILIRIKNCKIRTTGIVCTCIIFFILGFFFDGNRCGNNIPWLANIALMGTAFILVGLLLRKCYDFLPKMFEKAGYRWGVIGISVLFSFTGYMKNTPKGGYVAMVAGDYGNWFWFLLAALGGSLFVLALSFCVIRKCRILRYLGKNSMIIMMFHSLFLEPYQNIIGTSTLRSAFTCLLCVLTCIPLIAVVNRCVPELAGRWKK